MYGINYMKILWFAISYAFQKDVWYKWYENTLICNFLCFLSDEWDINHMKILWFAISYAFQKDVWDKLYENTLICKFLCFLKGCMG